MHLGSHDRRQRPHRRISDQSVGDVRVLQHTNRVQVRHVHLGLYKVCLLAVQNSMFGNGTIPCRAEGLAMRGSRVTVLNICRLLGH